MGDCLLRERYLHLKRKVYAELADGGESAEFCDLMDIFEPLPPEIMRWIDRETARYEFLLRDTRE